MVSDATMYSYMNIAYKKLWAKIVDIDKNYWRGKWTTNVVNGQQRYTLQAVDNATPDFWQYKVERVSIKYDALDEYMTDIKQTDWDIYTDWDYLSENQPAGDPMYVISWDSVYIYPTPDANVSNGLVLEWPKKPYDLSATTTLSSDILIPEEYHENIMIASKQYIYQKRNLVNEKNDAIAETNNITTQMLWELSTRSTKPKVFGEQDLSYLE